MASDTPSPRYLLGPSYSKWAFLLEAEVPGPNAPFQVTLMVTSGSKRSGADSEPFQVARIARYLLESFRNLRCRTAILSSCRQWKKGPRATSFATETAAGIDEVVHGKSGLEGLRTVRAKKGQ